MRALHLPHRNSAPMAATIKSPAEQEKMRIAGKLAADVLDMITPHVKAGISTEELDKICHDYIVNVQDAIPAPLNYKGFPKSICTSVNHVVCHGIPGPKKLKKGDIINIDVTVIKDGYHGDTSKMFTIGKAPIASQKVMRVAWEAMWVGIDMVKPGARLGDIGAAIQAHTESNHCSVVREFCGHGIGANFHEDPQVLHYGRRGTGAKLEAGMCFTIEPMVNAGRPETKVLPDEWTAVTRDRSMSGQWEHTLLVTPSGYEVLTFRSDEAPPKFVRNFKPA